MFEEYRTLCEALQESQRRWWRKTGAWWLAALALLVVLKLGFGILVYPVIYQQPGSQQHWWVGNITSIGWISGSLEGAITLIAICCSLCAAQQCQAILARLTRELPLPWSAHRRGALFLYALRQAVWPLVLLVVALNNTMAWLFGVACLGLPDSARWSWELAALGCMGDIPWGLAILIVWLIAAVVALDSQRWLVWLWLAVFYAVRLLYEYVLTAHFGSNIVQLLQNLRPASLSVERPLNFAWLAGMLVLCGFIRAGMARRRAWVYALGSLLLVSTAMQILGIAFPNAQFPGTSPVYREVVGPWQREALAVTGATLGQLALVLSAEAAWYEPDPASWNASGKDLAGAAPKRPGFVVSAAPVPWRVRAPLWVQFPLSAVNAAYLALLIWFIAGVLLREGKEHG